jgi:enoyl-CoA hydratase/carnithine racemase
LIMGDVLCRLDEKGLATLTLNRPEARNTLTPKLLMELARLVLELDANTACRVILLNGAGEHFCAGADVRADWPRHYSDLVLGGAGARDMLSSARKPVIAALQGAVFGGGLELALTADVIVASEDAQFALPEFSMGALPISGVLRRMVRCAGAARTAELFFSGRRCNAREALEIGLVSRVVARDALGDETATLASHIAAAPGALSILAKSLLADARGEGAIDDLERHLGYAAFSLLKRSS